MKNVLIWIVGLLAICFCCRVLWAEENCFTVPGHDAEERMQNMEECREANALEKIAENSESHIYGDKKTEAEEE